MEPCKYEKEIGALVEASKNFKGFMEEMRDNHLKCIYKKLSEIKEGRPGWVATTIIAGLGTLCGILLTIVLRG